MLRLKNFVFFLFFIYSFLLTLVYSDSLILFRKLLADNDYRLLQYTVVTEDGYLLDLHRIVPMNICDSNTYNFKRKPVILQHGFLGSSNNFFLNTIFNNSNDEPCDYNFGFCLISSGRYDVWSANSRANGYSNGRKSKHKNEYYWAFTFDQMAKYDLPATIDFVRNMTGHSKIAFVGHSQGTLSMFALLVSDYGKRFANIIQPFIAWGPPVYIQNMTSKLYILQDFKPILDIPLELKTFEILDLVVGIFCKIFPINRKYICPEVIEEIYGKTTTFNFDHLAEWLKFIPNISSTWSLLHIIQLYQTDHFQHFDYGHYYNWKHYNQSIPPRYELKNFPKQINLQIFNGLTDGLIQPSNARKLLKEVDPLMKHSKFIEPEYKGCWNHLDYLFSTKAGSLVYKPSLDFLDANSF